MPHFVAGEGMLKTSPIGLGCIGSYLIFLIALIPVFSHMLHALSYFVSYI